MDIIKSNKITWIDIESPTSKDIKYLKENFNFHPLVLEELTPPSHRSRVDNYGDYLFLLLHVPGLNKETREVESRELDIIATKDTIITSSYQSIFPIKTFFNQCNLYEEARAEYMSKDTGHLLYFIIERIIEYLVPKLDFLETEIDEVEDRIFKGREREMLFEISILKRAIIDLRRAIESQKILADSLIKEGEMFWGKYLKPYFLDLAGGYSRIWQALETQKETIEALEDTNQALLTTKINEVMRVLTVFASIALPLTLIASIFGMNVSLPFAGKAGSDFWIVLIIMILTLVILAAYFKKQKWL